MVGRYEFSRDMSMNEAHCLIDMQYNTLRNKFYGSSKNTKCMTSQ